MRDTVAISSFETHDRAIAVGAAILVGTAALMVLGIQPLLLSAVATERGLGEAAIGQLATAELLTLAIGSLIGGWIFQPGNMRSKSLVLSFLLLIFNIVSMRPVAETALFALRSGAGLVEGLMLGCTIVVMTRAHHPHRVNGIFLAVQTIPQAVASYLLPVMIIPTYGAAGVFGVLLAFAAMSIIVSPFLPTRASVKPEHNVAVWTVPAIAGLLAVLLQNAGISAAWSYSTQLATNKGFSHDVIGIAHAGSLVLQVIGALGVAAISWRWSPGRMLALGCVVQATLALWLTWSTGPTEYISIFWIFGLFLLGLGPFQIQLLIAVEKTRGAALMVTSITLFGWSVGPLVASWFVSEGNIAPALYVSAISFLLSCGVYYFCSNYEDGVSG